MWVALYLHNFLICSGAGSCEKYYELQSCLWSCNVDEGCQENWIFPLIFTMKITVNLDLLNVCFLFVFSLSLMKNQNAQFKLTQR